MLLLYVTCWDSPGTSVSDYSVSVRCRQVDSLFSKLVKIKPLGRVARQVCSIAIELNVPRDDFSSIAIELTFVTLGHGFKKVGSVLFDICVPGTRTFKVRLHHSIFAYLGGDTVVYSLYYK